MKMNYVFDGVMRRFNLSNVWVVLLEEDHYVSPDFLHVMDMIIERKMEYVISFVLIFLIIHDYAFRTYFLKTLPLF